MGRMPRRDGSVRAEPSRKGADAEKAGESFASSTVSSQPDGSSHWLAFHVDLIRACRRKGKRVPKGVYLTTLRALSRFAMKNRPGGLLTADDKDLAYWIFDRREGRKRDDLPYHPVLDPNFDPLNADEAASPQPRGDA